jgi:hypothetical protein
MEKDKIIQTLKDIKSTVDTIDRDTLYNKTTAISSILERFYGQDSAYQSDYKYIRQRLGILVGGKADTTSFGPDLKKIKSLTHGLLDNLILEASELGLPTKAVAKESGVIVNTNVNQSQKQSQSIDINIILHSLKSHLTGQQYSEVFEIAQNEPDPSKAKATILEKLKSFGGDVCSNIVANLLTSPEVWTGLLG